jgi:hypothetical protein
MPTIAAFTKTANAPSGAAAPSVGLTESKPEMCQKKRYDNVPMRNRVATETVELMSMALVEVTSR